MMLRKFIKQIISFCKGIGRGSSKAFDVFKYAATYPWQSSQYEVIRMATDPLRYLDEWIRAKNAEHGFVGLAVSS
jgi:hypothetical protein